MGGLFSRGIITFPIGSLLEMQMATEFFKNSERVLKENHLVSPVHILQKCRSEFRQNYWSKQMASANNHYIFFFSNSGGRRVLTIKPELEYHKFGRHMRPPYEFVKKTAHWILT